MNVQVPSKRAKRLLDRLLRRNPAPTTVTMSGGSDRESTTSSSIETRTTCSLYTPLTDKRSIRLLTIDASTDGSGISCRLVPACLDDLRTSYLALSYTWGDPKRTETILCNDAELEATESLIGAMKQLACQYPGRSFWVDAICINQQDLAERAAQVPLMRDIYKSAENVIIYLGEERAGLDRAMDLFHQLERGAIEWEANNKADTTDSIRGHFPPPYEESWSDFHDLFSRPWFSRMWIIQEVVTASADPDVLCGRFRLQWSSFVRVATFFQETGLAGSTIQKSRTSNVALIQDFKTTPRKLDALL